MAFPPRRHPYGSIVQGGFIPASGTDGFIPTGGGGGGAVAVFIDSVAEVSGGFLDNIVQALVPCAVGDLRLVFVHTLTADFTAPAGWTLVATYSETVTGNLQILNVFARVKQGGDTDANITLTNAGGAVGGAASYAFLTPSVLSADTPTADLKAGATSYFTVPDATVALPATMLMFASCISNATGAAWDTNTAGWTKDSDLLLPNGLNSRFALFQTDAVVVPGVTPSASVRCQPGVTGTDYEGAILLSLV